ncbi:MAG: PadR family transcriptional regulator [Gemmatimonadetes bacterium]|nr:PadR family transcriptional regulator [Gemmatimonadota bacterium]NNK48395.1 hypothetical protein [Gemmatimonadota bacterium]
MRRYAGLMFDIERTILRIMGEQAELRPHGVHAYELADLLLEEKKAIPADETIPKVLRANGTIYKLMHRLGRIGAVTSSWEEPEVALAAGRPRRRYYVLTENGRARAANLRKRHERHLRFRLPETDPRTFG